MSILVAVVSALATFIFTGLIATSVGQRWGHKNWLNQQRFLGAEKDYTALKELADEIARLSGSRLARMRRLLAVTDHADIDLINQRLKEYDEVLALWNERLGSFSVRLTMYAGFSMAKRLEEEIQLRFRSAGAALETLVRRGLASESISPSSKARLGNAFNQIQGLLVEFNKEMLRRLKKKQQWVYDGELIRFRPENLGLFPTRYLFKALFMADVKSLTIIRSASDLVHPPLGRI